MKRVERERPMVAMVVTNDLTTDRRVLRHADALCEAGCEVVLLGRIRPWSQPVDTRHRVVRMQLQHERGWHFYAEFNRKVRSELRRLHPDVIWANDADTIVGCWAARRRGTRLVYDAHELMAEVPEVQGRPIVQWTWRTIERLLMPRCDALLTVCDSLSDHYRQTLGQTVHVVRNLPADAKPYAPKPMPSANESALLLYQGAINQGRGVDWAIDALEWLPSARLLIVGGGDLLEPMRQYAASKPWTDRIEFAGTMPPDELVRITPQATLGLIMLDDCGLSYHYALPNRVADFVWAGIPMVMSALPELSRVAHRYHVGELMDRPGGKALSEAVCRALSRRWSADDFARARAEMDWNKEKEQMLKVLKPIVNNQQ